MTGLAGLDPEVGALKVRAGLGVVEILGIEAQEVGLTALVFGVADAAVLGLVAVEAPMGGDPGGDLGVAGQTFGGARLARGDMADRAIALAGRGGVGGAERAGHLLGGAGPASDRGEYQGQDQAQAGEREDRVWLAIIPTIHIYPIFIIVTCQMRSADGPVPDGDFLPIFTFRGD